MKRDIFSEMRAWKESRDRKPLLLRGARQTGKTYLLHELGRREYDRVLYCDFEQDPALDSIFKGDLDPNRIIRELTIYKGVEFRADGDLLVLDEIQMSDRALGSLKYFRDRAPDVHVAAAGSLLGVKLSKPGSFPVGRVRFLDLYPMTFLEFLAAVGRPRYVDLLAGLDEPEPLPEAFHDDLTALLRSYLFVGGMPEAVKTFAETNDPLATRKIQEDLLDSFVLDFAKHAPTNDIPKLGLIWESIPRQLAKENEKFLFSQVRNGARAREFENALRWLVDAGLVRLCYAVTSNRTPLKHYQDPRCFKVYALDVGLLNAMARTPPQHLVAGETIFTEYRGALTESYVAQELVALGGRDLHYWRSSGGKAEIDFLVEHGGEVVPLEVKAGPARHSKSLASYDHQFLPRTLVRTSLSNLRVDGKSLNIPLYAVSRLPDLLPTSGHEPDEDRIRQR
jgi:predicted AAA+ superfamily ATPase